MEIKRSSFNNVRSFADKYSKVIVSDLEKIAVENGVPYLYVSKMVLNKMYEKNREEIYSDDNSTWERAIDILTSKETIIED